MSILRGIKKMESPILGILLFCSMIFSSVAALAADWPGLSLEGIISCDGPPVSGNICFAHHACRREPARFHYATDWRSPFRSCTADYKSSACQKRHIFISLFRALGSTWAEL
jgi:hypothetical protein